MALYYIPLYINGSLNANTDVNSEISVSDENNLPSAI